MAQFVLGSLDRDMPLYLDLSAWGVPSVTPTGGTAYAPSAPNSPLPGFRVDRVQFTGSNLFTDNLGSARGTLDTLAYQTWGFNGYYEKFSFTGLNISFRDVIHSSADLMPLLLSGNDSVTGNDFANTLYGFAGNDKINGGAGDDKLYGGAGNDQLTGGAGADRLDGGTGVDTVNYSTSKSGVIINLVTGKGNNGDAEGDTYWSIENAVGSRHNDTIFGSDGRNVLKGGAGNDTIDGGKGVDRLYGNDGDDTIIAGDGNDRVHGGAGNDMIFLGAGRDIAYFATGDGTDTINDFDTTEDRIDLSGVEGVTKKNFADFITDTADGAVIDFGHGDKIILLGVDAADLNRSDFLF